MAWSTLLSCNFSTGSSRGAEQLLLQGYSGVQGDTYLSFGSTVALDPGLLVSLYPLV